MKPVGWQAFKALWLPSGLKTYRGIRMVKAPFPLHRNQRNLSAASAEIFAELVAVILNKTDWKFKGPDAGVENPEYVDRNFQLSDLIYHNNQFTCTRSLLTNMLLFGEAKIPEGAGAWVGKSGQEEFIACPSTP